MQGVVVSVRRKGGLLTPCQMNVRVPDGGQSRGALLDQVACNKAPTAETHLSLSMLCGQGLGAKRAALDGETFLYFVSAWLKQTSKAVHYYTGTRMASRCWQHPDGRKVQTK